ncbi:MAG: heavy metal translocating P-type ATPase [Planctomycetota bacterium]
MAEKTQVDIGALLPSIADERDACIRRLNDCLITKEGILAAHYEEDPSGKICIHFDPDRLSLSDVLELAHRAGADIEKRYGHLLLKTPLTNTGHANVIESRAKRVEGVLEASVALTGMLRIEFDRQITDEATLREELRKNGVFDDDVDDDVTTHEHVVAVDARTSNSQKNEKQHHDHSHGSGHSGNTELIVSGIAGLCLLVGWLASWSSITPWFPWACYFTATILGGFFAFWEAIESVAEGHFEIDFLMLVAALGAAILGHWFEGALLLFLFSIGHALENYAMGRAKHAIESMAELAPKTALVKRGDQIEEVPIDRIQRGDTLIVKPNERLAADGFVVKGQGFINQAPITGESLPAEKWAVEDIQVAAANPDHLDSRHRVFAGTINGPDLFEMQVTKEARDSTLARVIQLVNEAETKKSPTQLLTNKFERYFVPIILVSVILILGGGLLLGESWTTSFYRAMAVLVAASPCALAISTPSAVLSGIACAARGGVLVKGGGPLENLGKVRTIAFDKTGTLTEGKPRLTDVVNADGVSEEELLEVAVAVEKLCDHPLASAVVKGGSERLQRMIPLQAHDVQSITGRGVRAVVDNQSVYLGNEVLFDEVEGQPLPAILRAQNRELKASGRTTIIVRKGDRYLGFLGLMDAPRSSARSVIDRLRNMGIERVIMLSGDNQHVANAVAREVGIDEAMGDLLPEGKVEAIGKLANEYGVAMIGDGVNDAPAMANATVGVAMGAAGSDVALETADVALMGDDLSKLPFAVGLSRQTSRIIRQNLWISLGMIAFLVPATIFGLSIGPAVVLHEGTTVLVVFNALRLLAYRVD